MFFLFIYKNHSAAESVNISQQGSIVLTEDFIQLEYLKIESSIPHDNIEIIWVRWQNIPQKARRVLYRTVSYKYSFGVTKLAFLIISVIHVSVIWILKWIMYADGRIQFASSRNYFLVGRFWLWSCLCCIIIRVIWRWKECIPWCLKTYTLSYTKSLFARQMNISLIFKYFPAYHE